ncbi:MAG: 50S ribosomal protein L11 methyltransferase [Bacteroidales bacterium]|nr:50S ribosomal protein L11 methyltransferase [Bacteroidales bacterium]
MFLELSIQVPLSFSLLENETLLFELTNFGFESFNIENRLIKAYKSFNNDDIKLYLQEIQKKFKNCVCSYQIILPDNWNRLYRIQYRPIIISKKIRVIAPFHKVDKRYINIIIDPGMAFGTGHHHTTKTIIELLTKNNLNGKTVLDIGCGTGILSILCEKLGASKIVAIDIDENAINSTLNNIKLNNCKLICIYKKSIKDLNLKTNFDYILANLTRNTILDELDLYAKFLKLHGKIIISGFLKEDKNIMIHEFGKRNFFLDNEKSVSIWQTLEFVKN